MQKTKQNKKQKTKIFDFRLILLDCITIMLKSDPVGPTALTFQEGEKTLWRPKSNNMHTKCTKITIFMLHLSNWSNSTILEIIWGEGDKKLISGEMSFMPPVHVLPLCMSKLKFNT